MKTDPRQRCGLLLKWLPMHQQRLKKNTGVGYRGIMTAFDATKFSCGPAGGHGAQASGSVEKGTAGAEIRPREIPGYLANNADYVSTQRAIMAMDFLAETLHHV